MWVRPVGDRFYAPEAPRERKAAYSLGAPGAQTLLITKIERILIATGAGLAPASVD
jgi:hypothetical protein